MADEHDEKTIGFFAELWLSTQSIVEQVENAVGGNCKT
jgi:hypothetical protein